MTINVRIVGIFYNQSVDLGAGGGTVQNVLDAAVSSSDSSKSFGYVPGPGSAASPSAFAAYYSTSFSSPTPGVGKTYPPGVYYLGEDLTGSPYTVWQYYIFDANNTYLNRGKGAISFSDPAAHVPDGGSVVWRLVSVLAGPNPVPGKLNALLNLEAHVSAEKLF